MSEMTNYQPNPLQAPQTPQAPQMGGVTLAGASGQVTQTTVDLVAWANELGAAHHIAKLVCGTDFVPAELRNNPDKTATAILYGKSIGLDPLAALSNVFVVHGKPAIYARTMVALAQRAGVKFRRTEATEQQVTIHARRREDSDWQPFTWTMARAERAGYTRNQKYKTDPIGMLTAKAQAEAVRVVAPEVLMGLSVSEDLEDEELAGAVATAARPIEQQTTTSPAPVGEGKKVRRAPAKRKKAPAVTAPPAPVVEAPAPETAPAPTEAPAKGQGPVATGELADQALRDQVAIVAQAQGVDSREAMDAHMAQVFGSGASFDTMTVEQAQTLLGQGA